MMNFEVIDFFMSSFFSIEYIVFNDQTFANITLVTRTIATNQNGKKRCVTFCPNLGASMSFLNIILKIPFMMLHFAK